MFRRKFGDGERAGRACALERGPDVPRGEGAAEADRRTVTKSAVLAAALLLAGGGGIAQARAADNVTVRLPAPTGPYRIGVTTLYLVDRSRRDPWDSTMPVREVMVTVFYPARTVRGYPVARQMAKKAAESFTVLGPMAHPELPTAGVNWAATMTHSHTGAPAQAVRRPVLLYSPGGGDPRTMATGISEELASHGYVVVTIDHPGDATEVEFPSRTAYRDKVLRETVFRGDPRADPQLARTMIGTRVSDTRFVLNQLEVLAAGRNPDAEGRALSENLGRALDLRQVGIYGHSAGGATAAETMYEDHRIDAAVNLEGYLDFPPETPGQEGKLFPIAEHGADRPLLLLGTDGFPDKKGLERSWSAMLAHSQGCTRRRQLDNAAHWVFTDYGAIAPQLQAGGLMTADNRIKLVGAIDPATSLPMVRNYVLSFFARHLPSH
jgi:predicted dienelactone hydrolase